MFAQLQSKRQCFIQNGGSGHFEFALGIKCASECQNTMRSELLDPEDPEYFEPNCRL